MGPRQKSLGNFAACKSLCVRISRFNGAEAKKPRKFRLYITGVTGYRSFNGAEAKKPRKLYYLCQRTYRLSASMGPRQKSLGNLINWAIRINRIAASMGPRQKSLGNIKPKYNTALVGLSFNGAEAKKPRKY